jgi:hypothetical protein
LPAPAASASESYAPVGMHDSVSNQLKLRDIANDLWSLINISSCRG